MTDTKSDIAPSYSLPFPSFAGKCAEGLENTVGVKEPSTVEKEGRHYFISEGYYVPCYIPERYGENKRDYTPEEETERRAAIAHELSDRYFNAVERGSDLFITYDRLQYRLQQYEQETDPYEKTREGAICLGIMVKRTEALSEMILHDRGNEKLDTSDKTAKEELKEHLLTFLTRDDLVKCVRLRGNREDPDGIIEEMLSEVTKAANSDKVLDEAKGTLVQAMLPIEEIHQNRVIKIGSAMKQMDETLRIMEDILSCTSAPADIFRPLSEELTKFTEKARARSSIRMRDDEDSYYDAEVGYKAERSKVDHRIQELRRLHTDDPELLHSLALVEEGRRLIDDTCYARTPLEVSMKHYHEKYDQWKAGKEPTSYVLSDGSSIAPAYDRERNQLTPI